MHLNFRQGLISYQQSGSIPIYLIPSGNSQYLDINVSPVPLLVTIAHGSSDYLFQFDTTVLEAFGPLVPSTTNYLYLELSLITGLITYGISTLEPITASAEPTVVTEGQMWFDLSESVMKVRSTDNTKWIVTPRLVIGRVLNGNPNQVLLRQVGSAVGLETSSYPGFLMLDSQLRPLRTSTGELLTSDSRVRIKSTVGTSGVLALPTNGFIPARASEPIPALRVVSLTGPDTISLASSDPAKAGLRAPIGIVLLALSENEIGSVTQAGEITSDQWNFLDEDCGKPLYCGFSGEVTLVRPRGIQAFRVGYVKSARTILFYIDSETLPQIVSAPGSIISGIPPIITDTVSNVNGEVVTSVSIQASSSTLDGYISKEQVQVLEGINGRIGVTEGSILTLQTSKADAVHSHVISSTTGLQDALDNKSGILHTHTEYALAVHAHPTYALASHAHTVSDVTGLQTVLNGKADSTHAHVISDVTALQEALNDKAFANHTHTASNISNFSTAVSNILASSVTIGTDATSAHTIFGSISLNNSTGSLGQVLTSGGAGAQASWISIQEIKPKPLQTSTVTSTSIVVGSSAHHNQHIRVNASTDATVSVPPDSTWAGSQQYFENNFNPVTPGPMPIGGCLIVGKTGLGNVTFVPGAGVTINTPDGLSIDRKHGKVSLIKIGLNEWDIEGNLAEAVAGSVIVVSSDPYFSSVSLLLHGDGTDSSTVFLDSSPIPKTITAIGLAKISTTQSKFGGSSMYFDGTNSYLTVPASSSFEFENGDFTIECWFNQTGSTTEAAIFRLDRTNGQMLLNLRVDAFGRVIYQMGNSSIQSPSLGFVTQNIWHHVAVSKVNGVATLYYDGVPHGTLSGDGTTNVTGIAVGAVKIGTYDATGTNFFKGYIDELRITKGTGRYTTSFTPPTSPF